MFLVRAFDIVGPKIDIVLPIAHIGYYDYLEADVELGGTDQKFNPLVR